MKNNKKMPYILVIDSESSNTFLLFKTLSQLEVEIITVSDAWEALEYANKLEFALILLDILMPKLNGYEILVRIKSSSINKSTPIFLMTEMETDQDLLVKAYNAGAVDFISRPVNLKILQRKAKYFLDFYKQNQDLKDARTKAELLMKSRLDMMADITHELRTPLFAMLGMIDGLKSSLDLAEQKQLIHRIEVNSENLLDTVNEFLNFSKFESSEQRLENEFFGLKKLLSNIIDIMNYQYHKNKKVELKLDYGELVPEFVRSDRKKIRHILMNLFSNAIKFTQEGSISLKVRNIGEKKELPFLTFSVIDTGVGIPQDRLTSIFDEYAQVENQFQGMINATGLGLSIVKKMVDVFDGQLEVKSSLGKGSVFSFSIPVETANESDLEEVSDPSSLDELLGTKKVEILVVDDVPDNLFVLKNYLNVKSIKLSMTHKVDEALELMRQRAFDIAFIDINLPEKNGFELVKDYKRICEDEGHKCGEIVMLSSYIYDEDMEKKLEQENLRHYLEKPIKKGSLFKKVVSMAFGHENRDDLKVSTFKAEKENREFDFDFLDQDFLDYLPHYLMLKEKEMSQLLKGIEAKNEKRVLEECHKILGTAKSFGLYKFAKDLEKVQLLTKEGLEQRQEEVQELAKSCYDIICELRLNLGEILNDKKKV